MIKLKLETNTEEMTEAISAVRTAQVTYAVRDTSIEGVQIKDGQLLIQDTQQLPEAIAQARSTQFGVYHSQRQQVLTTIRDFLGTL